jgi:biopolymer transport protein ExbB
MSTVIRSAVPAVAALAAMLALGVQAQPAPMDELLQQIRETGQAQQRINRERENRFLENRNEQQQLLRQARQELAQAQQRAERVRREFDAGQAEIRQLKERLQEATGELGRMYAAARTTAGDLRTASERSMITAQRTDRLESLSAIADNPALPTLEQLEDLWFLLTQDMADSGRVVRFEAEITDILGNRQPASIIRIGGFTAFTADGYLTLPAGGTTAQLLPRQPSRAYTRAAARAHAADAGEVVSVMVDPSRGLLLEIESEKPRLMERIDQGGVVGYTILGIGAVGALLALYQLIFLGRVGRGVSAQLRQTGSPRDDNPLGRVLGAVQGPDVANEDDAELLELRLSEAVVRETPPLERFQSLLKLFVAVAPLLGLLGTVTGMILTFQAITVFGTGDPKLMAQGISQALITTVLGLCVAIPLLFVNSVLATRSRALVQVLDEQSALVLARRLEGGDD